MQLLTTFNLSPFHHHHHQMYFRTQRIIVGHRFGFEWGGGVAVVGLEGLEKIVKYLIVISVLISPPLSPSCCRFFIILPFVSSPFNKSKGWDYRSRDQSTKTVGEDPGPAFCCINKMNKKRNLMPHRGGIGVVGEKRCRPNITQEF